MQKNSAAPLKTSVSVSAAPCEHCLATEDKAAADPLRHVVQPRKKALLNRLRRINGQINGITQMVEQDRYCVDIITQIAAARAAMNAVSRQLLADHANGCVRNAVLIDGGEEAIAELLKVIEKIC